MPSAHSKSIECWALIWLLSGIAAAFGAEQPAPEQIPTPGRGQWKTYRKSDGLAGREIHAVGQDRNGYLWFGTNEGASRFDGEEFVNFTANDGLGGGEVLSIHRDRDGVLWLGTEEGASRFDDSRFTAFTPGDGMAGSEVSAILDDDQGNLWLGTENGLSRFDGQHFENYDSQLGLEEPEVLGFLLQGGLGFGAPQISVRYPALGSHSRKV